MCTHLHARMHACVLHRVCSRASVYSKLPSFPHLTRGMLGVQIDTTESTQLGLEMQVLMLAGQTFYPRSPLPVLFLLTLVLLSMLPQQRGKCLTYCLTSNSLLRYKQPAACRVRTHGQRHSPLSLSRSLSKTHLPHSQRGEPDEKEHRSQASGSSLNMPLKCVVSGRAQYFLKYICKSSFHS